MVYLIDGQDMSTPMRIETVGKNQFKGFAVLDRWMVEPPLGDLIKEFGPNLGKPKFYNIIGDSLKLPRQKVHHSRVIRFDGDDIPYYQRLAENGWGLSILEPLFDRLIQFDSATTGAAQLTSKAHLRTLKVKKLREIIAMGGQAYASLLSQISQMRLFQQSEGITLLDAEDDFEVHPYTFTGHADMIQQFSSQLSGSLGIPVTRLFGVSPGGLNATGQSDLQTYYDKIKQLQSDNLKTDIIKTLNILHMSTLSKMPGQDLNFTFRTLWQIDASAKAEIASKNATTIGGIFTSGIVSRETALKELKQQSDETGVFSNITDEEIHEAKNDPPPGSLPQGADPQSGQPPRPEEAQGSPGAAGAGANEAGAGQPRQAQPAPDNLAHLKGLKSVPEPGQAPLALKPEHAAKLLTLVK
jgi:phage-related protein (TIGR01555 family)